MTYSGCPPMKSNESLKKCSSKTYDEVNGKHCPAETEATKRALCVKARPTNILRLLQPIRYALLTASTNPSICDVF
jgi:hypothetical protein